MSEDKSFESIIDSMKKAYDPTVLIILDSIKENSTMESLDFLAKIENRILDYVPSDTKHIYLDLLRFPLHNRLFNIKQLRNYTSKEGEHKCIIIGDDNNFDIYYTGQNKEHIKRLLLRLVFKSSIAYKFVKKHTNRKNYVLLLLWDIKKGIDETTQIMTVGGTKEEIISKIRKQGVTIATYKQEFYTTGYMALIVDDEGFGGIEANVSIDDELMHVVFDKFGKG